MNDLIRVEHAALEQAMDTIQNTYNRITSHMETLDADLKNHLQSFSGEAQRAYSVSHGEWTAAMNAMNDHLRTLHTFVDDSRSAMIHADKIGAANIEGA